MIETLDRTLKVIESFKTSQLSEVMFAAGNNIVGTLLNDYVSEEVKNYFYDIDHCPLYLMSSPITIDDIPKSTNATFVLTTDNKLYYYDKTTDRLRSALLDEEKLEALKKAFNNADTNLGTDEKSKCLFTNLSPVQLKTISTVTPFEYVAKEPFSNFAHQPKQIVQIKGIINALYHAQLAFSDLENVDLRKGLLSAQFYKDVATLYSSTIEHGYKASRLLTHLDIDIAGPFQKEIGLLLKLFVAIKDYADGECGLITMSTDPREMKVDDLKKIIKYPSSYILFNSEVFYVNKNSELKKLTPDSLGKIQPFFPNKNNSPIEASKESLAAITKATEHRPDGCIESATEITKVISEYPISFNAGRYTGIAIDQMQPNSGQVDYHFLTSLGAILPGYIQQFTEAIHKASSDLTDFEPTLDKAKIAALEEDATKLLNAIDGLQDGNALLSLKVLSYIRIIRHIITMSTSIFEQMGHMSEKTQDLIRDKLATIKYEYISQLFSLADKIEDELLLAPGTLSKPLKQVIEPFYQGLIHYASKPVDFSTKGEELLTIEDPRFIEIRLQETQKRINDAQERLIKAELIKKAFNNFFIVLEKAKYSNTPITELPELTKKALTQHYRYIQPFVEKYNIDINNEIIHGLNNTTSYFDVIKSFYHFVTLSKPVNIVGNLVKHKQQISALIDSEIASNALHITLNTNIIADVYKQADISLRPVNPKQINFKFDEVKALQLNEKTALLLKATDSETAFVINNHDVLTDSQALTLYTFYEEKNSNLLRAQAAFTQFFSIVQANPGSLITLPTETKETLRNLYLIFQPYFYDAFAKDNGFALVDKAIVTSFKTPADTNKPKLDISDKHFLKAKNGFENYLQTNIDFSLHKKDEYYQIAIKKFTSKTQKIKLTPNCSYGNRNHHIIKHTHYSAALKEFRTSLFKLKKFMSASIADQLIPAKSGLPFPELTNLDKKITQSKQILCLKQIFNTLYHLEQVAQQLESLNDKSYQWAYVSHLVRAHSHIDEMHKLITNLLADPHLSLIAKELMMRLRNIQQTVVEQSDPYIVDAASITGINLLHSDVVPTSDNLETFPITLNKAYIRVENDLYYADVRKKKVAKVDVSRDALSALDKEFFPEKTDDELPSKLTPEVLTLTEEQLQRITSLTGHQPKQKIAKTVKLSAIWYPMQTLMLVPEHLHALLKERELSDDELAAIQINTKNIVLAIERIIESSNSYFKLLLEVPAMYSLFKELRQKLAFFTTTTHGAVMSHLQEIKSEYFTKILLETDHWENLLGLEPGLLSGKMKEILDEFYKGLVEPLGLVSQQHIDCVNNTDDFVIRISTNNKKAVQAELQQNTLRDNQSKLSQLNKAIQKYEKFTSGFIPPASELVVKLIEQELLDAYKDAYPVILKAQKAMGPFPDVSSAGHQAIDKLIEKSTDTSLKMTNIFAKMHTATSYYKGLEANFQLEQDMAKERSTYLDALYKKQLEANKKFIEDYTNKTFERRVNTITARQTELLHVNSEYNEKLRLHLISFQQDIVKKSLSSKDIKRTIKKLVHEKHHAFQEENLPEYAQLDNVLAAVAEFKVYIKKAHELLNKNKSPLFEDLGTLTKKNAQINRLESLAQVKSMPVKARIETLREEAGKAAFKIDIMSHRKLEGVSLDRLKRCLLKLLSALGLYTPKHIKHYERFVDSVSEEPKLNSNLQKHGFFADSDRNYGVPKPFDFDSTPSVAPAA